MTPNIRTFASEKEGKMNISLAPSPVALTSRPHQSFVESSSWRGITKKIPEIAFVSSRILSTVLNFYSQCVISIILHHCLVKNRWFDTPTSDRWISNASVKKAFLLARNMYADRVSERRLLDILCNMHVI